ncbi:unnamed protein product, partial [Mesorhabditis belari]|uniref:Bridge-like lipid transfer protein family member 1 C-terminal domain-containing protein n=1 Tax=Mesorhabditis belari TaxID=2138241 RepID=A0AAF3J5F4_9BILA
MPDETVVFQGGTNDSLKVGINYGEEINPDKVSFWVFIFALVLFMTLMIFLTYYFSRCIGPLVAFLLTKFLRFMGNTATIRLGSISISFLAGKLMFRNFVYICDDFSIKINDGWVIFSYWWPIAGRRVDFKSNVSRLHIALNGLQVNCYNTLGRYKEIARLFRQEKLFGNDVGVDLRKRQKNAEINRKAEEHWDRLWAFVGVISLEISAGKCTFGNKLLPYIFALSFENFQSKIFLAPSTNDRAELHVNSVTENVQASFHKSAEYSGDRVDEPPRTMGDGFSVVQTAKLEIFYTMDILGIETADQQSLHERRPVWESVWRFGQNTVFSYGPWAEAQRFKMYSFFFPPNFQTATVTEMPKRGEPRIRIIHEIRVVLLNVTTIDLWFLRGDQLESMHTRCKPGSSMESTIWWITQPNGFSWTTNLSLLNVESTTSLINRRLLQCETLSMGCDIEYPKEYNAKQTWKVRLGLSKATMWLVWDHKRFFNDLINDWIGDEPSDLTRFVPYTVSFDVYVPDNFEVILWLNEGNWVDTQVGVQPEGVEAAIVGEKLSFNFVLPFIDFLPKTIKTSYFLSAERELAVRLRLPNQSSMQPILASLFNTCNADRLAAPSTKGLVSNDPSWFEIWRTERFEALFTHCFHPMPGKFPTDLPYHVVEEFSHKGPTHPKDLPTDSLDVALEVEGSMVMLTGMIIKIIVELKNNYFGFYDQLTDVTTADNEVPQPGLFGKVNSPLEYYRPIDITLAIRIHNVRAHLLTHMPTSEMRRPSSAQEIREACPTVLAEQLVVEMKKNFNETMVQVGIGTAIAHFNKGFLAEHDGYATLSGLQFRGHAMFSPINVPWDMAVNEYAWLMEVIVGDVQARLLPAHVVQLVQFLDSLFLVMLSPDEDFRLPDRFNICQHGAHPERCKNKETHLCPSEEALKYRNLRVSLGSIQIDIVEQRTLLALEIDPLRFTLCNVHQGRFVETITVKVPKIQASTLIHNEDAQNWIEAAKLSIDNVAIEITLPRDQNDPSPMEQSEFLRKHDAATKRLYFLQNSTNECTCSGGTRFFAELDKVGKTFWEHENLEIMTQKINPFGQQPGFLQSILQESQSMILINSPHLAYTRRHVAIDLHRKNSFETGEYKSEFGSTLSFYSAFSENEETHFGKSLLNSAETIKAYARFLDKYELEKFDTANPPQFCSKFGTLDEWRKQRKIEKRKLNDGISELHLRSLDNRMENFERKNSAIDQRHNLGICGKFGDEAKLLLTPLGLEALDKLLLSVSRSLTNLHPAYLAQCLYRQCTFAKHRQPLTATLFADKSDRTLILANFTIPTIHLCLFSCNSSETSNTASVLLVRVDSGQFHTNTIRDSNGQTLKLSYKRQGELAAQYLRFFDRNTLDFLTQRLQSKSTTNWATCRLAKEMYNLDLRPLINISAAFLEVIGEIPMCASNVEMSQTKTLLNHGSIDVMFIMARPLEMTGRNEFPIFEAISPTVSMWFSSVTRIAKTMKKAINRFEINGDIKLLELLSTALDDPNVLRPTKSCMSSVKKFHKNFSSCPSCQVIQALLRYTANPSTRYSPLPSNFPELHEETNRKAAIRALLSHWQTVICKYIKVASNQEALKYVGRLDDGKETETLKNEIINKQDSPYLRKLRQPIVDEIDEVIGENEEKNDEEPPPKMDLYQYVKRHRELRKEERKREISFGDKEANLMEISLLAFFYSLHKNCHLDYSFEVLPLSNGNFNLEIHLDDVSINVTEHRCASTSDLRQFFSHSTHQLFHLKRMDTIGKMNYRKEMDQRRLRPLIARIDLEHACELESIRCVVAISSVCLIKELALVAIAVSELSKELSRAAEISQPLTPVEKKPSSASIHSFKNKSPDENLWIRGVLEKTKAFQKTNQRRGLDLKYVPIELLIKGNVNFSNIRLESILTDLCIAVSMQHIAMTQTDTRKLNGCDPKEKATQNTHFSIFLRRATLAILESEGRAQRQATPVNLSSGIKEKVDQKFEHQQHILDCSLQESHLTVTRKIPSEKDVNTFLRLSLGAIEGDLPMAAQSLHDVVLRHGPQLERQFDRLSAQPTTTTTQNPPQSMNPLINEVTEENREIKENLLIKATNPIGVPNLGGPRRIVKVAFNFEITSIELAAQLLPSLRMKYRIGQVHSQGITGEAANWTAELVKHEVRFTVQAETRSIPEHFSLPLPKINVIGTYEKVGNEGAPISAKQLHYREGGYLDVLLQFGRVDYTFTTDLLNQILFAEQSFRSEMSLLISRIRSSKPAPFAPSSNEQTMGKPLLFSLKVEGLEEKGIPWLQLTASTPTSIAFRLTLDNLHGNLTNRWVVREAEGRERIFGVAEIELSAKLGQLCKPAQFHEVAFELQEYASFMTQIRLENKEGTANSNYSYLIALNRPILLIKSMAFDKAILLWLNYKNTYDYWRTEMTKAEKERMRQRKETSIEIDEKGLAKNAISMFSPQPGASSATDININMSLSIQNGMYICMPLIGTEISDGMAALVISLEKSDVNVCVRKELACQAVFESFKVAFVDNYDEQSLSDSFFKTTDDSNYCFFPSGTYQFCSQASTGLEGRAEWVLSIRSQMQGMQVDLDQRIGRLAKLLVNTFTSFGEDDDFEEFTDQGYDLETDLGEEDAKMLEEAAELQKIQQPEGKVRWIERKMHEEAVHISELVQKRASERDLEAARVKLRRLELIRFKQFRRTMIEKWRRSHIQPKKQASSRNQDLVSRKHSRPGETASINKAEPIRPETTVDMHIDLQLNIASGLCILRTMQKEGSQQQTGFTNVQMSKKPSAKDLRKGLFTMQQSNETRFSIPSVDIKGYYASKEAVGEMENRLNPMNEIGEMNNPMKQHLIDEQRMAHASSTSFLDRPSPLKTLKKLPSSTSNLGKEVNPSKRGCFYLNISLASMPTETVVRPHLADFLEQVLEPLPNTSGLMFRSSSISTIQESINSTDSVSAPIVSIDTSALPLDIILYLTIQSSTFRFEGQQQRSSAADCLLKLPCLTLMASTRRMEGLTLNQGNAAYVLGGVDISVTLSAFSLSIYSPHQQATAHDALSLTLDHLSFVISRSKNGSQEIDNKVRFVLTANVGSASFNYDMRRLSELIAFPKPWYRAAIMRRVFFGDQSVKPKSPPNQDRPASRISAQPIRKLEPRPEKEEKAWAATVQVAVQWKELNIFAQMSNAMGNTTWKARDGVLRGHTKLNSRLEREAYILFRLHSSELSAHGGAISGQIGITQLRLSAKHSKKSNQPPANHFNTNLKRISCRIEWMSRSVLIATCKEPTISVFDDWSVEKDSSGVVNRSSVSVGMDGRWCDLQMVITRDTVESCEKIFNKLVSFFQDQLKSSKIVWGIYEEKTLTPIESEETNGEKEERSHLASRFWEKVLDILCSIQMRQNLLPLPMSANGETVVGGSVQFEAGSISLACMHGEMHANSWAFFHMQQPLILFTPEALYTFVDEANGQVGILMNQKLIVRLGPDQPDPRHTDNFANVCRVQTRNLTMRTNASIDECLDHVIGEVLRALETKTQGRGTHSVLELFQFPALEAVLKTHQVNPCSEMDSGGSEGAQEVHSTFVCDFHNAVSVQTDFNAQVSFLPDLLKSYMKTHQQESSTSSTSSSTSLSRDHRIFKCEQWTVDPKIRFIDRIKWNPPVIDEVLKKLQIFDHRTTIPKSLQRALLDPLDVLLAVLMKEMLIMASKG